MRSHISVDVIGEWRNGRLNAPGAAIPLPFVQSFQAVAKALEIRPDLILMDIQLPKISGLEAMRRLRAEPSMAATPTIAITSFALSGDDQKAKEAGATAYIAKPYSPRDLLTLIRKTLPEV